MGWRGTSEVVQFRVTGELRDRLEAWAQAHGLASISAAARVLLLSVLEVETGASEIKIRGALARALAEEVVWSISDEVRNAIAAEVPKVLERALKRLSAR